MRPMHPRPGNPVDPLDAGDAVAPVGGCPVRVAVHDEADALDRLAEGWEGLLLRADEGHPYLSPAWARSWFEEHGHGPRLRGARSHPHLVSVHRGAELVALAPLLAVQAGVGPAAVRLLVGAGQENADYGGALVAAGDEEARRALAGHLAGEVATGRTVLNLTRLPFDSALLAALRAELEPGRHDLRCEAEEAYPRLDLRAMDDPGRGVARLLKANDVARRLRRLEETGAVRWVAHHPDAAGEGLAEFFRLHDLRWAGRRPSGPFASPAGRRFVARAAADLDREGLLRLSVLLVDDVAIAARFGTVFDGWYLGMKSGWDPAYARFAPGHLIMGRLVRDALDQGLAGVDLLRGDGAHKLAWANGERRVGYWTVARGGRRGELDRLVARALLRSRYRWRGSGSA